MLFDLDGMPIQAFDSTIQSQIDQSEHAMQNPDCATNVTWDRGPTKTSSIAAGMSRQVTKGMRRGSWLRVGMAVPSTACRSVVPPRRMEGRRRDEDVLDGVPARPTALPVWAVVEGKARSR